MVAQEVGHENSISTKLIALDPKPSALYWNWSCVLPACLGQEREGCPATDIMCVPLTAKGKKHDAIITSRHSAQEKELLCTEKLNGIQEQSTETSHLWRKIKNNICSKCYLQNNSFHKCLCGINAFLKVLSYSILANSEDHICSLISCPTQSSYIMKRSTLWNCLFKITLLSIKCQKEIWKWSLLHTKVTSWFKIVIYF